MKKHVILLSCLSLLSIVSCNKEEDFNIAVQDNLMGDFVIGDDAASTKSPGHVAGEEIIFNDLPYVMSSGDTLYISASISDMPEITYEEETKAMPVTMGTSSPWLQFGTGIYDKFSTRVFTDSTGEVYQSPNSSDPSHPNKMDSVLVQKTTSWSFSEKYYWPSDDSYLHFVSIAPQKAFDDAYLYSTSWDHSAKQYKFKLQSYHNDPSGTNNAEEQLDVLVAYNKQNKASHDKKVEISFKHILVGVQFQLGDDITGTIESITLKYFHKNASNCTLGASGVSYDGYDDPEKVSLVQEFNFSTDGKTAGTSIDTTEHKNRTFMILPQKMIDRGNYKSGRAKPNAQLVLKMANVDEEVLSFADLADPTKGGDARLADWTGYAGKIVTFRINEKKANRISVDISDEVDGNVKKNIVIKNTGSKTIYVRASLVGNWISSTGKYLQAWSESDPYGTFDNSFPTSLPANWKKGSDGYYYYSKAVKPNHTVSQNLFNTYTRTGKPSLASVKYLDFDILVQAVAVGTDDDKRANAKAVWGLTVAQAEELLSTTEE